MSDPTNSPASGTQPTVPAPAPAPAPAQAPTPAPPAAPVGGIPAPAVVEYAPTGDAALDLALEYVGRQGLGPDSEEVKAASAGDFSKLRAKLGAEGERHIALAEQVFQRKAEATKAAEAKTLSEIHGAVGGEANWQAIVTWAAAEATAEQKAEINKVISQGGLPAQLLAQALAREYNAKAPKVGKSALKPGASAAPAGSEAPLSRAEYIKALANIRHTVTNWEQSPQYRALNAKYMASKAR